MEDYRDWHSLSPGRTAYGALTARVCRNLRRIRELRGLSQAELGQKVGTTKSVVSKSERGDNAPTVEKLLIYANALDVPVAFLLLEDPESAMIVDAGRTMFFEKH